MPSHAMPRRYGRRARLGAVVAAAAVFAGVGLVALGGDHDGAPALRTGAAASPDTAGGAAAAGPLAGRELYVDPAGAAAAQVRSWETIGRTADAAIIRRIADQPVATWFADDLPGIAGRAGRLAADANRAGRLPVLTLYHIPERDCAGQSAGGAANGAAYRAWIDAIAAALRDRQAVVVLEPDAVAQAVQGCLSGPAVVTERYALLNHAITALRANPGLVVYLDAGNPSWIRRTDRMADALRRAGVARAHGFALNVANFETTADNVAYGTALSGHLGGAHFVVDTSRNGNGPAQIGAGDRHWCNPPGRKLGEAPTTRTGHRLVDAYLWIKRPGESDGACSDDAPPAGVWWPEYALGLAR